ncbi:MAG TPA: hypothetical protein VN520_18560 [Streptomyces sp.]|uniref:hypothetical protein n=1 Tax=Streptomyces sp. TaxID=1931 RepID=UPI002BBE1548|nr:hypothetical protein [Streptomyces sp.]HWU08354.1 hypothetical protein [Streptomyces sp.]
MTHTPNETREAPLNPEAATRIANDALSLQLGTTTRPVIEEQIDLLLEQLEAFFEAGLPEDETEAGEQRREIRALLLRVPGRQDPTFSTYTYMRALGRVLRRHISQYEARQENEGAEGDALPAESRPEQPSGTYRVPSGPAMLAAQRWLSFPGRGHR